MTMKEILEDRLASMRRMLDFRRREAAQIEADIKTDLQMILKTRRQILEIEKEDAHENGAL